MNNPYFDLKKHCPPEAEAVLERIDIAATALFILLEQLENKEDTIAASSLLRSTLYGAYEELYTRIESLIKTYYMYSLSGGNTDKLKLARDAILHSSDIFVDTINNIAADIVNSDYTQLCDDTMFDHHLEKITALKF